MPDEELDFTRPDSHPTVTRYWAAIAIGLSAEVTDDDSVYVTYPGNPEGPLEWDPLTDFNQAFLLQSMLPLSVGFKDSTYVVKVNDLPTYDDVKSFGVELKGEQTTADGIPNTVKPMALALGISVVAAHVGIVMSQYKRKMN